MGLSACARRVSTYLKLYESQIARWEVGNEVDGNWLGSDPSVERKLVTGYRLVTATHRRAVLRLYYDIGCGNGPSELDR